MVKAGLVLEGGGMRGVYTAGVLDFFIDQDLYFSDIYGVSAGACHMCSYISQQRERAYRVNVDYLEDKNYCSVYSLLKTGNLFGAEMCYDKIPNELDPYDYEAFGRYKGNAYAVVTNIETGKAEYIRMEDMHKDIIAIQASASLPLVSNNVYINGVPYLDGGVADAIPIMKSLQDGNKKNVVIMTKEVGYRRKPSSNMTAIRLRYRKYPELVKDMERRHIVYNKTLDFLEEHEKKGHIFVIRPKEDCGVGRIEKDKDKLRTLYQMGYDDAKASFEDLKKYLKLG
ncbi:MAG: patatin family protein [Lachnospiraceae bacterium]|nr:patatin family protein [Lachnospiraceae bacterium]